MGSLRRYEVFLPLLFNDGSPVPETLLVETFRELRTEFAAASWETHTLRGEWESGGVVYNDNLTRFFVDVPDEPEHREFFKSLKETLKTRFQQLDVWITSHPIDVI
ncbi:MAG: hypothetical protein H0X40_00610 [Chthoniobacterales bacterium]|nr:hypothetical protein [Chthoniobacterales bacterium]